MGQYYNGVKIGTCENMYYMRMTQAEKLRGATDDDGVKFSDYLADGVTRWRFPWPDEDGCEKAGLFYSNVSYFNRGYTLRVPADVDINHANRVCIQTKGCNVFIPCIHSQQWRDVAAAGVSLSHGEHAQKIIVRYDAMRDGERAILFECTFCEQLQRASREDWQKIWEHNMEMTRKPVRTSRHDREPEVYAADLEAYKRELEILNRMRPEWKLGETMPEIDAVQNEIDTILKK